MQAKEAIRQIRMAPALGAPYNIETTPKVTDPYHEVVDYFELMHRQDGNGRPKN